VVVAGRVPTRTCAGCRDRAPKGTLLRVARTPAGVQLDPPGRLPGRGAYVHRDPACVRAAIGGGRLARSLRAGGDPEELGRLLSDIEREMGRA
jgi:predicted RNA-binding protein YlxR (DUF448 family)